MTGIRNADVVTVTEHSNLMDYMTPERSMDGYKDIAYQVVQMTPKQKMMFDDTISHIDPKTQYIFSACTHEPHHRFRFYKGGKLVDSMEVCFSCCDVDWHNAPGLPPQAIYDGLAQVVTDIGLHPKAKWWKMYADATGLSPVNRD